MQGTMQPVVKCNVVDANELRYIDGTIITPRYNVIYVSLHGKSGIPAVFQFTETHVEPYLKDILNNMRNCLLLHMTTYNIYICEREEQKQQD